MRPKLTLLEGKEVRQIVTEALGTLSKLGILFEHENSLLLLKESGVDVRADRAYFNSTQVEHALKSAPSRIDLFDRDEAPVATLGGGATVFAPGSAALHVLDPETKRHRQPDLDDLKHLAWVTQACQHIRAQSTALVPSNVADQLADRTRLAIALSNSTKPIITGTFSKDGFHVMMEMLVAIRGSRESLRARPLAIFDCAPTSPLTWSDLTADAVVECAKAGIPSEIVSMPLAGATSPVTLRDTLIQHCAENIAGVVLSQLVQPGAPVIWACSATVMDMRYGTTPLGSMEAILLAVGASTIGKHLGLPTHAYFCLSDSKGADFQAGAESSAGSMFAALGNVDVVSGPGMLNFQLTQSLEKLVLDDEICAMAFRLNKGLGPGFDGVSADLIGELMESESFLSNRHTRLNHRAEISLPGPTISRSNYESWLKEGALSAMDRAQIEVAKIIARGNPAPLSDEKIGELQKILSDDALRNEVPSPSIV